MSDSTLRLGDELGLAANITCMTGAGLGQVAQVFLDHPKTNEAENIVLIGGTNDVRNQNFDNEKEFAENVIQSVDKMVGLAKENKEKKFTIALCEPDHEPINLSPEMDEMLATLDIRREFIHEIVKDKVDTYIGTYGADDGHHNLTMKKINFEADEGGHATAEGTRQILQALDKSKFLVGSLVTNEAYIANEKKYAGVEAIFLYGCNLCDKAAKEITKDKYRNKIVCDSCLETVRTQVTENVYPLYEEIADRHQRQQLKRNISDSDSMSNTSRFSKKLHDEESVNEGTLSGASTVSA